MFEKLSPENKKLIYDRIFPALTSIGQIFFNKNFLKGHYFEYSLVGWKWVLKGIIFQKICGFNRLVPWPVSPFITMSNPQNIEFNVNDLHIFQSFGVNFQNVEGKIIIGEGTWIGPNVGLITADPEPKDIFNHLSSMDIVLGDQCWIGMNATILPGVQLGDRTIVGAGSVVTESVLEGNCIIAGNPAKIVRHF